MKYLKSLLKYVVSLVVCIGLLTGLQLVLPQGQIELTFNQAVAFVVISVIVMAIVIKTSIEFKK